MVQIRNRSWRGRAPEKGASRAASRCLCRGGPILKYICIKEAPTGSPGVPSSHPKMAARTPLQRLSHVPTIPSIVWPPKRSHIDIYILYVEWREPQSSSGVPRGQLSKERRCSLGSKRFPRSPKNGSPDPLPTLLPHCSPWVSALFDSSSYNRPLGRVTVFTEWSALPYRVAALL